MKKSVFYGLNIALLMSTLFLNGCRFGNHSEAAKPIENPSQYQSIEFFFTKAKSFETKVVLNSLGGPDMVVNTNSNAPLASIPASVLNVLTDPVYFAVPKDPNYLPFFRDYRDSVSLVTQLDSNGNIALDYVPSDAGYLWNNPDCLTNFEITQDGTFDRTHPGTIQYEDGSTAPVAGKLSLNYTFSRIIASVNGNANCTDDLNRLAFCYQDTAGACSNDELSAARTLFDLYVKQTGVLKIEDAAKIKALEYKVHYE